MSLIAIPASAWERGVDWRAIQFHTTVHILGILGCAYLFLAYNLYTAILTGVLFLLGHLSIRLGAHSLYTHQAYKACYALHVFWVACWGLVIQGPIKYLWVPMHILHHRGSKTDPHNVDDGSLWSHMLWSCFNLPRVNYMRTTPWLFSTRTSKEVRITRLLDFQAKYAWQLGIMAAIVLPGLIAALWGDCAGGVLVAGFFRLFCQYHLTWQINSLSHLVGPQPYTREDSSRDSPWYFFGVPALLSVGEAWRHNFHHRYPRSCRIGWLDPGWWALWGLWRASRLMCRFGLRPIVWDLHVHHSNGTLTVLP